MKRLQGKVAVITGAASGMGLTTVDLFISEGATVIAADISGETKALSCALGNAGEGQAMTCVLDVSSEECWRAVIDAACDKFGRIDILVNNAGIHKPGGIVETKMDDWNMVLGVNLTGVWLGMKTVIPVMKKAGGGSIINTSSIAGIVGGAADAKSAAYSASKGAVRALTKHAAQWFAKDRIRVNSVHPGAVFTALTRQGGFTSQEAMGEHYKNLAPLPPHAGEALDIAYGYLYLASDESKFVTGEELVIDGGWVSN